MADVYARITGKPQVCFSTLGPGATNLSTGVASACLDRSPVVAVAAQVESFDVGYNQTHQCIDQASLMKPLVKYSKEIYDIKEIPKVVEEAFYTTKSEIKGPSFISLPIDLLRNNVPDEEAKQILKKHSTVKEPLIIHPDENSIKELHKAICEAKHPLAVMGNAVVRGKATEEVRQFLEKYNIPIVSSYVAKGVLPSGHPLNYETISCYLDGIIGFDAMGTVFSDVDLVILIGYDYVEDIRSSMWSVGKEKKVCRISPVPNPVKKFFKPDMEIVGNIKEAFKQLNKMDSPSPLPQPVDISKLTERKKEFLKEAEKTDTPIQPVKVIETVNEVLGKDGIFVSDVGLHRVYATLFSKVYAPNTFFTSCGCATFGFGLPAAMAVRLARPDKKIVAVVGDGGFHSNSQDLETAVRYNLPFVLIVMKDNSMGLIKMYQNLGKNQTHPPAVDFGGVDFVKLGEANGWTAQKIEKASELKDAILKGIESNKPTLLEVPIQYKYKFEGALKSRGLDDFVDKT